MKTVIPSWIVLALLLLGLTGCGSGNAGTVSGTVNVDGEPSGGFFVYFDPIDGSAEAIGGAVEDGSYSLTYGRGSNQIPVGEYRVYVTPTDLIDNVPKPKVKLETQYMNRESTTLVKKVDAGTNVIDLDIPSRKGK
ncbi:hypothetical protein [Bremerella alba]|uniref:Carboxypeptidase regulatory-like domain-containing protein n=1 Tax=Bremerella alba TaxID=980252 RepID=A0A7V8V1J5_9BACT|nr:hypothetical protein [Bremerella alba]MBA2113253.1 hypothetical protein [Bremerella alba]